MCMAIPSRIQSIDEQGMAVVECFGISRTVSLMLLEEPAQVGEYVIVSAGQFAVEKVPEEDALVALEQLTEILAEP